MKGRTRNLLVAAALSAGVAAGFGVYTFLYAQGASYLTDDPAACANCHVMHSYHDAWLKGGHRHVAVCNDCHTPPGFFSKYLVKALNGWHHSEAFTTGNYVDPIRIKASNRQVTESACRHCHGDIVEAMDGYHAEVGRVDCLHCHAEVGHMR